MPHKSGWRLFAGTAAIFGLLLALSVFALWPVCVPLDDQALASFNVPIEQRTDRDFYMAVFQQRDGRWHQCKARISRAMFF